jgi:hypothetical protein
VKRPPELRHAFATRRADLVDTEHRVLVAVERDRFAVLEQIALGELHVLEGRLGLTEPHRDQLARRIVDEHEQHAHRRPGLEPAMF